MTHRAALSSPTAGIRPVPPLRVPTPCPRGTGEAPAGQRQRLGWGAAQPLQCQGAAVGPGIQKNRFSPTPGRFEPGLHVLDKRTLQRLPGLRLALDLLKYFAYRGITRFPLAEG